MNDSGLIYFGELIFAYCAEWTLEIIGEILESGSCWNACFGYSYSGVIFPAAYVAYILFHVNMN